MSASSFTLKSTLPINNQKNAVKYIIDMCKGV